MEAQELRNESRDTSRKNRLSLQACIVRGSLSAIRTILGPDPAHPATPAGWALEAASEPRGTLFQPWFCRAVSQFKIDSMKWDADFASCVTIRANETLVS